MALVKVKCKKCGETSTLDTGKMTKEEVEKALSNDKNGFHCFGNHVEFGNRIDYWEIDWDSITEGSAPSEEDFVKNLKSKYKEVYCNKEIENFYKVIGFQYGRCIAENKETSREMVFNFVHSPKGTRYYIA
jgi:hypothetical protein